MVRSTIDKLRSEDGPIMQVTTVGIDLAKNVFQLYGCDATGKPVLRKQLGRRRLLGFVANLPCVWRVTEVNDRARRFFIAAQLG